MCSWLDGLGKRMSIDHVVSISWTFPAYCTLPAYEHSPPFVCPEESIILHLIRFGTIACSTGLCPGMNNHDIADQK